MSREKSILVDENDNIIGYKYRDELLPNDRYRIVAVWLENSQGQVLIAQRSFKKALHPGLWGPAAAGGVEQDESYEQAAYKELSEEIGIKDITLKHHSTVAINPLDKTNRMCAWFTGVCDKTTDEFRLEADVHQVKWVDKSELFSEVIDHPELFTPSCQQWPELFR